MGNPAGFFVRWPRSVQTAPKRASNGGAAVAPREPPAKLKNCVRVSFRVSVRVSFYPLLKNEMLSLGCYLGCHFREKNKP